MKQELRSLENIYDSVKDPVLFVGDFNFKLRREGKEKYDNQILDLIGQISSSKLDSYWPLIYQQDENFGTMASLKKKHTNDDILVTEGVAKRCVAAVVTPWEPMRCEGTDYSLIRNKDIERALVPLFTDHWPIRAYVEYGFL